MGLAKMRRKEREGGNRVKMVGIELGGRRDVDNFKSAVVRIKRKIQEGSDNRGRVRKLGIGPTMNRRSG